jgi:septum formation protein
MTRVVLGSASAGRRKVLRQAGIDPFVVVSGVDEDAVIAALDPGASPADVTSALATAKAERVADTLDASVASDAVVIGCDSMLYSDGRLHGKPESPAAVRQQWRLIAGGRGQLHTGHCVIRLRDEQVIFQGAETSVTTVHFGMPTAEELQVYIASGEPLQVAGGFTLDGLGGWFIEGVDGDPSSVVGLGLPLIRRLFERAGLSISQLWAANPVPPV